MWIFMTHDWLSKFVGIAQQVQGQVSLHYINRTASDTAMNEILTFSMSDHFTGI